MESLTRELIPWILWGVFLLIAARLGYAVVKERLSTLIRRYRRYRVAKTGVSARARIVEVTRSDGDVMADVVDMSGSLSGHGGPIHRILLMVHPRGGEPFGADLYLRLSREELDALRPDSEVNVMYDPNDTDIVALGGASVTIGDSLPPPPA